MGQGGKVRALLGFLGSFSELRITRELCFLMGTGKRIEPGLHLVGEFVHADILYTGVFLGLSTAFLGVMFFGQSS